MEDAGFEPGDRCDPRSCESQDEEPDSPSDPGVAVIYVEPNAGWWLARVGIRRIVCSGLNTKVSRKRATSCVPMCSEPRIR